MLLEHIFSISALINLAALLYFIGFMVRDELLLRLLILCGTCLYLAYYFLYPTGPLWNAIITSSILGMANIWVLGKIVFERTTLALTDDEKNLFECLGKLNPGQYRTIMQHAKWVHLEAPLNLCKQGEKADKLFYLLRGTATLEKSGKAFSLDTENFIGELAFILDCDYSASATLEKGVCYVEWDSAKLKSVMQKKPELANAVNAMFNRDIATKLLASYQ